MLGVSLYVLADTLFISLAEGKNGLTALNLVLPVYSLLFAIGAMLGVGAATRFAILRARGEKTAERCFANAAEWGLMAGIIFSLVGGFFPENIVGIMGGDAEIVAVGAPYTMTFMLFSPFLILNHIFTAFVRNDGAPVVAMTATLTSSLSNVALDYLFMFPLGMGMRGAALATGISPIISIAICSLHFLSKKNTLSAKPIIPSLRLLISSCKLGASAFVGEISSGVTTTVLNFILLRIAGNPAVAAYGVIANYAIVCFAIINGISQGAQPLVSRAYAKGRKPAEKQLFLLSMGSALLISGLILAAAVLFAPEMTMLFNSEGSEELASYAESGIRLYFTGFIFAGLNIVGAGYLSAIERAGAAFLASVIRGFAAIILFAFMLSALLGITGVWLAFPAAELLTLFVTAFGVLKKKAQPTPAK